MRSDWAVTVVGDEEEGCLQDVAVVEGLDEGCVIAVGEAVGGWPVHVDVGCHPAWDSAHRQVVHGGAHSLGSPGYRSSHHPPWNHLLHLCLPTEARDDDPGGLCHDGPVEGRQAEHPEPGEAQGKNDEGRGLGVYPGGPQVVSALPYGLQGNM